MKVAKILLSMACALLLQGCVTYSNPYEPTGRIQYDGQADYDPYAHDTGEAVLDLTIADASYYPWWSIDYYYLGNHYYRPSYFRGPQLSLGYHYGVPPYYWPYYGYYSPFYYPYSYYAWYDPWYGWPRYGIGVDIFWTNLYWNTRYNDHVNEYYPPTARDDYGVGRNSYRDPELDALNDARDRAYASERLQQRDAGATTRYISTLPSTGSNDTAMEVRSRRERKIEQSRIGPAPVQSSAGTRPPASAVTAAPPARPVPADSMPPVMSTPNVVRQSYPAQAQPRTSARRPSSPTPAISAPRTVRQMPAPQARPSAPVRPASPPASRPGDSDPSSHRNSAERNRN